jgi:hypothetical protein
MLTLRLTQSPGAESDHYKVEVTLEGARRSTTVPVAFSMSDQDRADLRWYLEDYLQYPMDPAPERAARVEARLAELGVTLFKSVFTGDAFEYWVDVKSRLSETRVEVVVSDVAQAAAIPWELLRDPQAGAALALRARAFVRAHANPMGKALLPSGAQSDEKIRILLVICRPRLDDDVPFRSVASRILKGLGDEARAHFQLDVLRPPTFAQLTRALDEARKAGQPYHVVHFDGHGMYADVQTSPSEWLRRILPLMLGGERAGRHGYLLFENAALPDNVELVDGPTLGRALRDAAVPVLVLNACRSADAELHAEPQPAAPTDDAHTAVRAFGSLAQEVMDAGVGGVVAMRYNLYVVTAAQFVADLYSALAGGQALGEAVSEGRKLLAAQPTREIAFKPLALQDWLVPLVYEAAPVTLFRPRAGIAPLTLTPTPEREADSLPPPPDVGFFGRDETLLALDRAFDTQRVVLLHAYAGSGKTTTAAEFARWYQRTGGLTSPQRGEAGRGSGAVLFTTFERYLPLPRVLDTVGRVFGEVLAANDIQWLALDDDRRRALTLQLFQQISVLWVWDNVEPVAGFPQGAPSAWSAEEQKELADFLRAASATQAKFLLTSRRDEQAWLGDLPRRIRVPPMPLMERVQLARGVADKLGHRLTEVEDWKPLLYFSQGNPMTLTVVVRQALTAGLKKRREIEDFVRRLRQGEAAFADEQSEGRDKSLGASLSYGFEAAFTADERKILALLHLFQGFVEVQVLLWMGDPQNEGPIPELANLQPATLNALLNRAAEIGLLTPVGKGYYTIHPALPWYFKALFEEYYGSPSPLPPSPTGRGDGGEGALRAYVEALGALGNYYTNEYNQGNRDVIGVLSAEEANLLHARARARQHGWWHCITSTMQGLQTLYDHTGRRAEWKRLVDEIVPDFVDPATDGPKAGREAQWSFVTEYRARLASEARQWAEAERLQRARAEWERRNALPLLAQPPDALTANQRNTIRTLAASLVQLADILREQANPDCVAAYQEGYELSLRIDDKPLAAINAFNLGHACKNIPALRDLVQAERWYQRSLELRAKGDNLYIATSLGQLGLVAYERFKEARAQKHPEEEMRQHLNAALGYYQQALALFPPTAVNELAVTHNSLGEIWRAASDIERTVPHYNKSIRYAEAAQNFYKAAGTRYNVALLFAQQGRFEDALLYAHAARRDYARYGAGAAQDVEKMEGLIAEIEEARKKRGG